MGAIDKKLGELGITLPKAAAPVANYVPFVRTGNLLVVSGQLCFDNDGQLVAKGQLGPAPVRAKVKIDPLVTSFGVTHHF